MLLESLPGCADEDAHDEVPESLRMTWGLISLLSIHVQFLLAGIIIVYSAVRWGLSAVRRGGPLR